MFLNSWCLFCLSSPLWCYDDVETLVKKKEERRIILIRKQTFEHERCNFGLSLNNLRNINMKKKIEKTYHDCNKNKINNKQKKKMTLKNGLFLICFSLVLIFERKCHFAPIFSFLISLFFDIYFKYFHIIFKS